MADIDKVIKGFECCHIMVHDMGPDKTSCGICPYKNIQTEEQIELGGIECIAVLHDDALALLKEQEAKPMIENERGWNCPACGIKLIGKTIGGYPYNLINLPLNFCPRCGQEVKWNG